MPSTLSPARRSELRAQAHRLNPVVLIGDKGLTDEVLAEIDRALQAHELIKVRAATDDRDARNVWMESICGRLGAHPVQQIGKMLVVYREKPKEAKAARPAAPAPVKRTSRPRSRTPSPRPGGPRLVGADSKKPGGVRRTSRRRSRTP